jgi:hypothetical protein
MRRLDCFNQTIFLLKVIMNFLDDEKYLLDLLTRNKLLTPEQENTYSLKKEAQRHILIRKTGSRRTEDRRKASFNQPGYHCFPTVSDPGQEKPGTLRGHHNAGSGKRPEDAL